MNYEDMSDFEINGAVAAIATGDVVVGFDDMAPAPTDDGVQVIYKVGVSGEFLDYCNNPNDAFPIIFENKISLITTKEDKYWNAGLPNLVEGCWDFVADENGNCMLFESYGENPLRAAMIVFLMMKDAEK